MIVNLATTLRRQEAAAVPIPCEHRTVAKDGRIVCKKIVDGDNEVSPNVCRACPFKSVNCAHLRFSLSQSSPSPLIVRFNGRTEVWDDDPPELRFERAACSARVMPIEHPRSCAGCALRQALQASASAPALQEPLLALPTEPARQARRTTGTGKVVPFPSREAVAAAG
jgi:hypothetical protein